MDHFALVAFPDAYSKSGRHCFIMKEDGKMYKKDLGKGEYVDPYSGPDPRTCGGSVAE